METALFLDPPILHLVSAVGVGALIGEERERRKGIGPARSPAGIRTFTITSISGAVAFALGGVGLLAVLTGSVAVMVAVSYWRAQDQDPGLTTEIVLVLTALLGGMCMQSPQTAAAIAVAVTVLLYAKAWLHNLVTSVISKDELDDALIFAAATLVVLPLVPNRQMGPYLALNPHSIWIVIVLVMAISAAGYVAVRLFGARFGLPLAGAISGFISSTATIGAMGSRAMKSKDLLAACVAGPCCRPSPPLPRWHWSLRPPACPPCSACRGRCYSPGAPLWRMGRRSRCWPRAIREVMRCRVAVSSA